MPKRTLGKIVPNKFGVEWPETVHVARHYARAVYIRVTILSLTTSGTTGQVLWTTSQLGWYLATRTGLVNHLGISKFY